MHTRLTRFLFGFFLLLASSRLHADPMAQGSVTIDDYRLDVEIADTQALRARGLMYRGQLAENKGMLFVYPDQALRGVWMKNTRLALDIIFLAADGRIVSLLPQLMPCGQDPCPIYTSTVDARYMLEVNAGFIDRHRIRTGQELMLDYRHDAPESRP